MCDNQTTAKYDHKRSITFIDLFQCVYVFVCVLARPQKPVYINIYCFIHAFSKATNIL